MEWILGWGFCVGVCVGDGVGLCDKEGSVIVSLLLRNKGRGV